jgi:DNA-binding CsgD family transcriptional regulator
MKFQPCAQNPWRIPREIERAFGVTNLKKEVSLFDKICRSSLRPCTASFFMINYKTNKFIVGNIETSLFLSHHPSLIEKEGFAFYKRILKPKEYEWMEQVDKAATEVFHQTPVAERINLVFSFEVVGKQKNGREIILQHVTTPYKLDENGNLWLGLCRVQPTTRFSTLEKAYITNHDTGELLYYIDGQFRKSPAKQLTPDEIQILRYNADGFKEKQIAEMMNISQSSIKRKKQELFGRLKVANITAAVYKASQIGII